MVTPSTHESLLERLSRGGESDGQDGDGTAAEAWQEFQSRYGELILDFGRRRGLQPHDCDDLLQDVLLALTKALPGFTYDPSKGSLRGYLKAVAMRAISRRSRQKHPTVALEQVEEPRGSDDPDWEAAWRDHHVRRAMQRIEAGFPESTWTAFRHYVLEQQDARDTAERLGISVDSVYQAKSRVLRRLSQVIAEQVREEG